MRRIIVLTLSIIAIWSAGLGIAISLMPPTNSRPSSVVAHQIDEAVTDPDLNAWYDSAGAENADKCAWMFGTTYKAANGSLANMKIGARDYLVQQNWKAGTPQGCALTY